MKREFNAVYNPHKYIFSFVADGKLIQWERFGSDMYSTFDRGIASAKREYLRPHAFSIVLAEDIDALADAENNGTLLVDDSGFIDKEEGD